MLVFIPTVPFPIVFKGLVVSTIDTTPVENGRRVQFNDLPNGRSDDTDAVFLKNIQAGYEIEIGFGFLKPPVLVYRAEQIKPEDIAKNVDKPPFCSACMASHLQ
jgi:hypothetical protein